MGWYGGQDGAARLQWREQSGAAYDRFRDAVRGSRLTSFYDDVADNRDRSVTPSPMLVCNPASQEDLVRAVRDDAPDAAGGDGGGWAVAVAASENLRDLSLLNDVAGRITGLFLYSCHNVNVDRARMEDFFSRLTNLEALTLDGCSPLDMCKEDGAFLQTVFAGGMLPRLKYLETDAATDDAIAAMATSPRLARVTFTYPTAQITNEGIQRLVDAGGARELTAVACGTLKKHLSKTLTMKYVAATLPRLVGLPQHEAFRGLSHMAHGKKKKSDLERLQLKHAAEDGKPFAVVPPQRMTGAQLEKALRRRGVKGRMSAEAMRSMFLSGRVEWTHDQELAFQNRDKLDHLKKELDKLRRGAAAADRDAAKLLSPTPTMKLQLYPLLGAYEIQSALRDLNVYMPSDCTRRDDRARLLNARGYLGGGGLEEQLAHYRIVADEEHRRVTETEEEIKALRRQIALRDVGDGIANASAGSKRNIQLLS